MKVYLLESRMTPDNEWYTLRTFTDQEEAEQAYYAQVNLYGHNTYFQLVEIKKRVVKSC
jgi:hypothetical protein